MSLINTVILLGLLVFHDYLWMRLMRDARELKKLQVKADNLLKRCRLKRNITVSNPFQENRRLLDIAAALDRALCAIGECDSTRFAMVVWCDCSEGVLFNISNDPDTDRIRQMLHVSAETIGSSALNEVAGHA